MTANVELGLALAEDEIDYFEWAREEYKKNHEKNNDQTLADAVAGKDAETQNNQMQSGFRRHSGR